MSLNQMAVAKNPYQGNYKKVLCVCSAGLLRSPTTAVVLSGEPFNYNTRAAGIEEDFALIPVTDVLLYWADEVVCMTQYHKEQLYSKFPNLDKPIKCLEIPDNFEYRNPELIKLIKDRYGVGDSQQDRASDSEDSNSTGD